MRRMWMLALVLGLGGCTERSVREDPPCKIYQDEYLFFKQEYDRLYSRHVKWTGKPPPDDLKRPHDSMLFDAKENLRIARLSLQECLSGQ